MHDMNSDETVTVNYDEIVLKFITFIRVDIEGCIIGIPRSIIRGIDEDDKTVDVPAWWAYKNRLM